MVPRLIVEESIYAIIGDHPCAVTGIPDEQRGERLVVLYTRQDMSPTDLWQSLASTELPKLWLPKRENMDQVDALPPLDTGTLDLRGGRAKAHQLAAAFA